MCVVFSHYFPVLSADTVPPESSDDNSINSISHPLLEDGEWEIAEGVGVDSAAANLTNPYLLSLQKASCLCILQDKKVKKSFEDKGCLGLFFLFLSKSWFKSVRQWTSKSMQDKGFNELSEKKFFAYLGIEMAMSLCQLNGIYHYWRKDMFLGCHDFQQTMSRNEFTRIRSAVLLRDPDQYDHTVPVLIPCGILGKCLIIFRRILYRLLYL